MDEDRGNPSNLHNWSCCLETPEMLECKSCGFGTNLKVDLADHFLTFHEGKENRELQNIFKSLQCKNCDFETHSLLVLTKHLNDCTSMILESNSTNGIFNQRSVNWFQCGHCAYRTELEANLKSHILIHMKRNHEKWFKCDQCTFAAESKSVFNIHIKSKHSNPQAKNWLQCGQCTYKTVNNVNLTRHIAAQHTNAKDIKWFKCDQCTYMAKRKNAVTRHFDAKHLTALCKTKMSTVSVESLIAKPFRSLSPADQVEIKRLGRPTPNLNIKHAVVTKNRTFNRTFNSDIYKKHSWVCGCEVRNALFCFPCLLFGGEKLWTQTGCTDLSHLVERLKRHSMTLNHMDNVVRFSFIENVASHQMDSGHKHDEKVRHNRYVLNNIINCVRFCGAFELAMKDHDKSSGLINFSTALDTALKDHLEQAAVFKSTSKTIQDEIVQTMFEVCQEEIAKEIQETDYLSVIVDETSDVSNTFQIAIIFRYITKGKPVERFWDFVNPSGEDPQTVASCILTQIGKHVENSKQKLIAQTYNGPTVLSKVQELVKQTYEHAAYVHCYAHRLDLILLNAASANINVRIFFANLQGICNFFSTCPQRTTILNEGLKKRLLYSAPINVCIVFEHLDQIIQSMRMILNESKNANTITQASGYIEIITSNSFLFWLNLFNNIMPHVDSLSKNFRTGDIDPAVLKTYIAQFETEISKIRSRVVNDAKEVCDIIISQVKDRFSFTGHLVAVTLFFSDKFQWYSSYFPETKFKETVMNYPFLDEKKLKLELTAIYHAEGFRSVSSIFVLYDYISQSRELSETFGETLSLLKILITVPMHSTEAERCSSTPEKIKTFLRNTVSEERLSALAMLSKERDLIGSVHNFNQRVIDKFAAASDRYMDFQFK